MAKITLEIEKCWNGCPYCQPRFGGRGDADDWKCAKADRWIATYVEYASEMPLVPQWCPIKVKEKDNGT